MSDGLAAAFERYEQALLANDAAVLSDAFWGSEQTVRFGVAEQQFGHAAIAAWRAAAPPLPPGRTLLDTRVVALREDVGVVSALFRYPGEPLLGRQSQTWIRLPEGWRIANAHVSHLHD